MKNVKEKLASLIGEEKANQFVNMVMQIIEAEENEEIVAVPVMATED